MQRLPLKRAEEGMVLFKDVKTPDGRVLCSRYTKLTKDIINGLLRAGVTSVCVEGSLSPKELKEQLAAMEQRFVKVKDDPVMIALMKVIALGFVEGQKG